MAVGGDKNYHIFINNQVQLVVVSCLCVCNLEESWKVIN